MVAPSEFSEINPPKKVARICCHKLDVFFLFPGSTVMSEYITRGFASQTFA
jgi:hypothetical protein